MKKSSRFATILHISSFLVLLYSLSMIFPILIGLIYGEHLLTSFLDTLFVAFLLGVIGWQSTNKASKTLQTRDGFMVAVLFWVLSSALSTLPLYLDSRLGLSFVDALFEGISGVTTTGASVLDDIDNLPKSILFYRAQLNFLGGLGIIVLAVAVLPYLGIGGSKLYQSEMPGPMKEERFTPRLADTARNLWVVYTGLAFASGISYHLAGMSWFDALCHALSTVSLGGFSTHSSSLGYYDSSAIELVGGVFSFLAAVNFSLYFIAITHRSVRPVIDNPEFRFFVLILSVVVGIACIELMRTDTFDTYDALVHGFFQTISVMTDNGLGSADFPNWPPHIVLLLLGASFFGGCVGSTSGGIKAMRFLLLYRQGSCEVGQLIHPSAIYFAKVGQSPVSARMVQSVWSLFFLYIFFSCVFVWALVLLGHDFATAFGTVAACINNMGIGYGDTAAGFGGLDDPSKLLMCLAMLFGRLEIFPIMIVCSRAYWHF